MTDERFEELERELADLEPTSLSPNFHSQLEQRLARSQSRDAAALSGGNTGWGWSVSTVSLATLAAVIFLIVVLVFQKSKEPAPLVKGQTQESMVPRLDEPPTLLAFQKAMANGDDLDELLELHARKLLTHVPDPLTDGR